MAGSRGEKHFKAGGNNVSRRKYQNVIVIVGELLDMQGNPAGNMEIPCSVRPRRADKALRLARTKYGNAKLEKRNKVA